MLSWVSLIQLAKKMTGSSEQRGFSSRFLQCGTGTLAFLHHKLSAAHTTDFESSGFHNHESQFHIVRHINVTPNSLSFLIKIDLWVWLLLWSCQLLQLCSTKCNGINSMILPILQCLKYRSVELQSLFSLHS